MTTELKEIYKCDICGNIVEVVHSGAKDLTCCGQPMNLIEEKTKDEGLEKHVPVMEKTDNTIEIKVGDTPHPMEDSHYIEWIEAYTKNGKIIRVHLNPSDKPKVTFKCQNHEIVKKREYCNIHGLWANNDPTS